MIQRNELSDFFSNATLSYHLISLILDLNFNFWRKETKFSFKALWGRKNSTKGVTSLRGPEIIDMFIFESKKMKILNGIETFYIFYASFLL